jgi:hemolysin activation/secretion protein
MGARLLGERRYAFAADGRAPRRVARSIWASPGLLLLVVSVLSSAAAEPGAKGSSVPEFVEKKFEAQVGEAKSRKGFNWRPPAIAQPQVATAGSKVLFVLEAVEIEGATALSGQELATTYQSSLKKPVSERDLAGIVDGITRLYHERGFTLSRAFLAPQDVRNGRVRITVLEGRIEDIVLQGKGVERFGLRRLLDPIMAPRPLSLATLERHLLLVNDTPGARVADVTIEEIGQATGRFRLTVYVETWRMWTGVDLDNRGPAAIGPLQTFLSTAFNSLAIGGETLIVNLATTPDTARELRFGGVVLDVPIGSNGTRLGLTASYSDIWPDDFRRRLRERIETEYYAISGTVVSFRTRESSLWLSALAAMRNADETSALGAIYHDRIRYLGLDAVYQVRDAEGSWSNLALGLRYGADVFGASAKGDPLLSRVDASSNFAKAMMTLTRLHRFSEHWSLLLAGTAQLASAPLLASEEFYLGGPIFGRAFRTGDLGGDAGLAGMAEVRFDQPMEGSLLKGYQVYAFIDSGVVWERGSFFSDRASLSSFGGGLRLSFQDGLRAGFEVASPLGDYSASGSEGGLSVFFTLSKALKSCSEELIPLCPSM